MEMSRLERKILGMLRRRRMLSFGQLSMSRLIRRSGGAFREVTIALINLEQEAYIRWSDKSSLQHISLLRKAYGWRQLLPSVRRTDPFRRSRGAALPRDSQTPPCAPSVALRPERRSGSQEHSPRRRRAD
ncbi:hypothetical protein [Saccharibacillus deserti]|uniref:hypothetical protein n=1 Tax=Saccharibacillus deserti TaxID=1634444 RepID=UPI001554A9A5|nr:hypothetical protein [Saccharibacillus deserti]